MERHGDRTMFKTKTKNPWEGLEAEPVFTEQELNKIGEKIRNLFKIVPKNKLLKKELEDKVLIFEPTPYERNVLYIVAGKKFGKIPPHVSLEKINLRYASQVNKALTTPKYTLEISPRDCDGDNCIVGLNAKLTIYRKLNDEDIRRIAEELADAFSAHNVVE